MHADEVKVYAEVHDYAEGEVNFGDYGKAAIPYAKLSDWVTHLRVNICLIINRLF
jgi:hypothetical protein